MRTTTGDGAVESVHRWTPSSSFLTNVPVCPLSALSLAPPSSCSTTRQLDPRHGRQEAALPAVDARRALNVLRQRTERCQRGGAGDRMRLQRAHGEVEERDCVADGEEEEGE